MGYKISEGLKQYQNKKRKDSEEKILSFLLTSNSLSGWNDIWKETKIYKNNIRPILDDLISKKKIIQFKQVKQYNLYQTKKQKEQVSSYSDSEIDYVWEDFVTKRSIIKDVYIPNLRNKEVFDYAKQNHLELFNLLYQGGYRKEGSEFLKTYRKKYSKWSFEEAFVRTRGSREEFYDDENFLEFIHNTKIGTSLIFLLNLTKNLPSRTPTRKFLEKHFDLNFSKSMINQILSKKNQDKIF